MHLLNDKLLSYFQVLDPTKRLGSDEMGGFELLKKHTFYEGLSSSCLLDEKCGFFV